MTTTRRIGCHRLGGRWYCFTAADLLALLCLQPDGRRIDVADYVPGELLVLLDDGRHGGGRDA